MNEIMTRQAGEIGSSVGATLRGPVRNDTAARALANSRRLYDGLACLLAEVSTSYEDATITVQQGARLLTREMAKNISANIETSFEAVEALAGCTDLIQAVAVQTAFAQRRVIQLGDQLADFHEIVFYLAMDALQAANAVTSITLLTRFDSSAPEPRRRSLSGVT